MNERSAFKEGYFFIRFYHANGHIDCCPNFVFISKLAGIIVRGNNKLFTINSNKLNTNWIINVEKDLVKYIKKNENRR